MYSTLFHIGGIPVHGFGLCLALGFLAAWQAAARLYRKTKRNPDDLSVLVTWTMISGIVGARVAYVLEHWTREFADNPMQIFRVDSGGLMFYGGLIGAILAGSIYLRIKRENYIEMFDIALTAVPIGQAFGRLGCFLHGCCHGKMAEWGVCFPKGSPAWHLQVSEGKLSSAALQSLPVIPSQLLESIADFGLFLLLFLGFDWLRKRPGSSTMGYLAGYAIIRYCVELTRGDDRMRVVAGIFSISQFISVCLFTLAVCLFFYCRRKWPKEGA